MREVVNLIHCHDGINLNMASGNLKVNGDIFFLSTPDKNFNFDWAVRSAVFVYMLLFVFNCRNYHLRISFFFKWIYWLFTFCCLYIYKLNYVFCSAHQLILLMFDGFFNIFGIINITQFWWFLVLFVKSVIIVTWNMGECLCVVMLVYCSLY